MSQIENKMDGFVPFGGKAQYEYQEDELAIPTSIADAVINALDDIMFPMDERRIRRKIKRRKRMRRAGSESVRAFRYI